MAETIILIVLALMNICQFFAYRSLRRSLGYLALMTASKRRPTH